MTLFIGMACYALVVTGLLAAMEAAAVLALLATVIGVLVLSKTLLEAYW